MDRKEEFRQRLESTFRQEAADHLQSFVACLLALENAQAGDLRATVEMAYREMHSLKGAAAVVGRTGITLLCQAVESYFSALQRAGARCSRADLDVLHRAAVQLDTMLASETIVPPDDPTLVGVMAAVTARAANPAQEAPDGEPAKASETKVEGSSLRSHGIRVTAETVSAIVWGSEQLVAARASGENLARDLGRIRRMLFSARYGSTTGERTRSAEGLLREIEPDLARLERFAARQQHRLTRTTEDLRDHVRALSLSPVRIMLEPFAKVVRDLAGELGKQARVEIEDSEMEVDRRILEQLRDPLLHLVRNAVGHGIEAPADRAGKPAIGVIRFELRPLENQQIELAVSDDGAGIDFEQVAKQAVATGRISPDELQAMDGLDRREILFLSGVSTRAEADELAGRGLGLSIVRSRIQAMGGSITVESQRGQGTTFRMHLPRQIATLRGVLVHCSGFTLAVPVRDIYRVGRLSASSIQAIAGRAVCDWNGRPLPVVRLDDQLGLASAPAQKHGKIPVLYLGFPRPEAVLCVDAVLAEQELLLQAVHPPVQRLQWYLGMALNEEGGVVPILKSSVLLNPGSPAGEVSRTEAAGLVPARSRKIVLAEDTATTRIFLKELLQSHGYEVSAVGDGQEAWQLLQQMSCDLVLTDVEMPRLDGYELTRRIRSDENLKRLPVILVTALDSTGHRQMGSSAGADAYLVKDKFDHQQVINTIARFLDD